MIPDDVSLPAAAASPQPCELSDDEKIDAYMKLSDAAMKEHFASPEFQRRIDEAAQSEGFVPPGFDLAAYCGYGDSPLDGITAEDIERGVRDSPIIHAAVLAERERCAKIAEQDGEDGGPGDICCDGCHEKSARQIAARIRSGE